MGAVVFEEGKHMKIKRKKNHKETALERKVRETWNESVSIPRSCILCDELTMRRGIFVPDDPQKYGAPDGGEGAFIYPLCLDCRSLPHEKIFPIIKRMIFFDDERVDGGVKLGVDRRLPVLIFKRLEGRKSGFFELLDSACIKRFA